jgi:hypothetical protein
MSRSTPKLVGQTRKTARQQAEHALALAEDLKQHQLRLAEWNRSISLAAVADLSPVPLALLNRRGIIISAGKPLFDLLEAPSEDVLFHSVTEFLHGASAPALFKFLVGAVRAARVRFSAPNS